MNVFFEQIINGLTIGSFYALIALGYSMVYGVMKLINFAHGDLFTLGAYTGFTLLTTFNLVGKIGPMPTLFLFGIIIMGLVGIAGIVLERIAYRPLRSADRLAAVVSALGASIVISNSNGIIGSAIADSFSFFVPDLP